jgi:hypothetical protein
MKYTLIFIVFWSLSFVEKIPAQTLGFQFSKDVPSIEIPYEMYNNLIVIDLVIEKKLPVKFVFDTGAEHTIICKKEITTILGVQYEKTFSMLGADFKKVLTAYLVKSVSINLVNDLAHAKQDVLVLEEDYYRFDETSGLPIHGIIGADMFNRYVVGIDYHRKKIKLTQSAKFKVPNNYTAFPIEIIKGKPYFYPQLSLRPNESFAVKLLIDTGAGVALLLFSNTHPLLTPPSNSVKGTLALGLGGRVEGFVGKVNHLQLTEKIVFSNITTAFQDVGDFVDSTFAKSKNGIFGEILLQRFDVIIDYVRGNLYLKPNRAYRKPLPEDRSGLSIIAQGQSLNQYIVNDIIPGSPANWADIRVGDSIKTIGRIPCSLLILDDVTKRLRQKAGKTIHITIVRNGRKYKKRIILKDLF